MGKLIGPGQFTEYESPVQPLSIFQERLPTDDGQLHILTCAGVGDNLWVIGKFWSVCQQRDVTFWLPDAEQRRSSDIFRMCGLKHGYMPNLTTNWIWSRPGSPPIPDSGAVISIQVNRHLEHGHRIEKWYPELPYKNPVDFVNNTVVNFKSEAGNPKYVVGFMGALNYMEYGGNLKPAQWARIWKQVERDVAPVALIAAAKDIEFAEEVMKHFDPSIAPIFNASLDTIMTVMAGAEMCIGAHAGPLILSTYMKIPTVQFMPRWLWPMAGTWEMEDAIWHADFLDNAENFVKEGIRFEGFNSVRKLKEESIPKIYAIWDTDPKWKVSASPKPPRAEPTYCTAVNKCFAHACENEPTTKAEYGDGETLYACAGCERILPRGFTSISSIPASNGTGLRGSKEDTERVSSLHDKEQRADYQVSASEVEPDAAISSHLGGQ